MIVYLLLRRTGKRTSKTVTYGPMVFFRTAMDSKLGAYIQAARLKDYNMRVGLQANVLSYAYETDVGGVRSPPSAISAPCGVVERRVC